MAPQLRISKRGKQAPQYNFKALERFEANLKASKKAQASAAAAAAPGILRQAPPAICPFPSPHNDFDKSEFSGDRRAHSAAMEQVPEDLQQFFARQHDLPIPPVSEHAFVRWFCMNVNHYEEFLEEGMTRVRAKEMESWVAPATYLLDGAFDFPLGRKRTRCQTKGALPRKAIEIFREEDEYFLRWEAGQVTVNGKLCLVPNYSGEMEIGPLPDFAVIGCGNVLAFFYKNANGARYMPPRGTVLDAARSPEVPPDSPIARTVDGPEEYEAFGGEEKIRDLIGWSASLGLGRCTRSYAIELLNRELWSVESALEELEKSPAAEDFVPGSWMDEGMGSYEGFEAVFTEVASDEPEDYE
ncbi:MAG: hypothetical protein Q9174_002662 [Haloplaca sp. 1 TL-2023]